MFTVSVPLIISYSLEFSDRQDTKSLQNYKTANCSNVKKCADPACPLQLIAFN